MTAPPADPVAHLRLPPWQLGLLCFVALSPSLGTALAALGRLALYLLALGVLLAAARGARAHGPAWRAHQGLTTVLVAVCAFLALSMAWSSVDGPSALWAWSRHARILAIPLLYYLVRDAGQGRTLLHVFILTQVFVGLNSWLLVAGIHPPWISAVDPDATFASYGSYLEETIAQATTAGLLWFERDRILGPRGRGLAIALALSTAVLALFFLRGRSGHVVLLAIGALVAMEALPPGRRWLALLLPFVAATLLWFAAPNFRERVNQVVQESAVYHQQGSVNSSSGERLLYWHTSLQAIAERPLLGYGAGSWNHEFRRILANTTVQTPMDVDNPHQLFLLWAVEGGVAGLACLVAALAWPLRQARHLARPDAWALRTLVCALAVSGLFNSMIYGIGMGDFFCVGLGLVLSLVPPNAGPTPDTSPHS